METKFKQGDKVIIHPSHKNKYDAQFTEMTGTVQNHYVINNVIYNQVHLDKVVGYALWERGFVDEDLRLIK